MTPDQLTAAVELADLGGPDPTWADDALCAQTDPDAFFPPKGGGFDARAICRLCTADHTACLADGIQITRDGYSPGFRAGLAPGVIRRAARRSTTERAA